MPTRDVAPAGHPVWIDLSTSDPESSRAFYDGLFGWTSTVNEDFGGYVNFSFDGHAVAGAMAKDDADQPDRWGVYLAVDDIEATFAKVESNGGTAIFPPHDVGTLGRMAFCMDPGGAMIGMWQSGDHKGFGILAEPNTPAWFELHTRDFAKAVAFYENVFGWEAHIASDTDEFRYCTLLADAESAAGIMDGSAYLPEGASSWAVYFGVDDADAAVAKAVELGGTAQGPVEDTPYGRMVSLTDSTGTWIKLLQPPTNG